MRHMSLYYVRISVGIENMEVLWHSFTNKFIFTNKCIFKNIFFYENLELYDNFFLNQQKALTILRNKYVQFCTKIRKNAYL